MASTRGRQHVRKYLGESLALEIEIGSGIVHCGTQRRVSESLTDGGKIDTCFQKMDRGRVAQRFLSIHGQCNNLFRLGRHLLSAASYRVMRQTAVPPLFTGHTSPVTTSEKPFVASHDS